MHINDRNYKRMTGILLQICTMIVTKMCKLMMGRVDRYADQNVQLLGILCLYIDHCLFTVCFGHIYLHLTTDNDFCEWDKHFNRFYWWLRRPEHTIIGRRLLDRILSLLDMLLFIQGRILVAVAKTSILIWHVEDISKIIIRCPWGIDWWVILTDVPFKSIWLRCFVTLKMWWNARSQQRRRVKSPFLLHSVGMKWQRRNPIWH